MDKIDNSILDLLQENARIANSDIAKKLNMAPSAIWERIKKLEEKNIIKKYSVVIDPKAMDLNILAFVTINIDSANWSQKLSTKILSITNIEELHEVIGEDSYLAKVRAKNMYELSDILKNKIGIIPEVKATKTTIAINSLKENSLYQTTKS
ncbi:MAG: Lrp/AsnC family transcriptional regulator [Rickettsiales bacterium]|jgi:Lrp/AsnC family transcriptional regulator, leucine-responsive regulatory protein|nr:Lrp/AsnC family transcriptional regulator [Rickettsiales bacterium]